MQPSNGEFTRMDDYAIALDHAIARLQRGDAEGGFQVERLREDVLTAINAQLRAGGDSWRGGNLILSAATTAVEAARSETAPRLTAVRRDLAKARHELAEEHLGQ
jgi:hypothetical protein